MTLLTIIIISVLFGCGTYLILQRGFIRILFGFSLYTHASNLFVLAVSKDPVQKVSPIVKEGVESYVDPLPQALILTAIVIGFGVSAYLVVLLYRLYQDNKTIDSIEMFKKKRVKSKS